MKGEGLEGRERERRRKGLQHGCAEAASSAIRRGAVRSAVGIDRSPTGVCTEPDGLTLSGGSSLVAVYRPTDEYKIQ